MSRTRVVVAVAVVTGVAIAAVAAFGVYRRVTGLDRPDRDTAEQLRQQIIALDTERTRLRARLDALAGDDQGTSGMPDTPVRVGVPTRLARDLIERVVSHAAGRVTVRVGDIRVRRTGTVRRGVALGEYDLRVTVNRVSATLSAGTPRLTFGGNRVGVALPLSIGTGSGRATVDFAWDGRALAGAVCGDMTVSQVVTGTVKPRTYQVAGALLLSATSTDVLVQPRLPRLRVHIDIVPSPESWRAMQAMLDEKRGLCGFVLDRVDIMGAIARVIERGFDVRIPTERVRAIALPVGVEPTMIVRGEPVALAIRVGDLAVTEQTIWLGAHVSVARARETAADSPASAVTPSPAPR